MHLYLRKPSQKNENSLVFFQCGSTYTPPFCLVLTVTFSLHRPSFRATQEPIVSVSPTVTFNIHRLCLKIFTQFETLYSQMTLSLSKELLLIIHWPSEDALWISNCHRFPTSMYPPLKFIDPTGAQNLT